MMPLQKVDSRTQN